MIFYEDRKAEIGRRIAQERRNLGMSKKAFLPKLCMSESSTKTLTAWESGELLPSLDNLAQMADLFDCDIGYLLCDYDERRRDYVDACELTGLSEDAVKFLHGDISYRPPFDSFSSTKDCASEYDIKCFLSYLLTDSTYLHSRIRKKQSQYGSTSLMIIESSIKEAVFCESSAEDSENRLTEFLATKEGRDIARILASSFDVRIVSCTEKKDAAIERAVSFFRRVLESFVEEKGAELRKKRFNQEDSDNG